jgi:hypothetical protein
MIGRFTTPMIASSEAARSPRLGSSKALASAMKPK